MPGLIEVQTELADFKVFVRDTGEVYFNASFVGMIFPDEVRELRERVRLERERDLALFGSLIREIEEGL